jgi:tetratricopeptide (TPR) repeat protein
MNKINCFIIFLIILFSFTCLVNIKSQDEQLKELYINLNRAKEDTTRIMAMYNLYLYYREIKIDSTLYYAKKAYLLSKKNNNYESGRLAMALGHAYGQVPDYEKSITYLTDAYNIAQKLKYKQVYALLLSDLGSTYLCMNDYDKAQHYLTKALEASTDYNGLIVSYFNLAQLMTSIDKNNEALDYYNKALELTLQAKNTQDQASVYNRLGEFYTFEKDFKKGISYYEKSMALFDSTNLYYKTACIYGLAEAYLLSKNYKFALKYCLKSDSAACESGFGNQISRSQKLLSEIYDSLRRPELALKHYKVYSAMQDSIITVEKNDRIGYLHVEFETKEMELQLEIMQKEAIFKNRMLIMYLALSVLTVTILAFVIKNIRLKNKKLKFEKEREIFMKQKIEMELHEKQRELLSNAMHINQQKDLLSSVKTEIMNILGLKSAEKAFVSLKNLDRDLKSKIDMSDNWSQIKLHFEKVHPIFFNKLKEDFPDLSINELKLCAYTKLQFSGKEIGQLLNINHTSVQMARYRLKKKMGLAEEVSFNDYIMSVY